LGKLADNGQVGGFHVDESTVLKRIFETYDMLLWGAFSWMSIGIECGLLSKWFGFSKYIQQLD
jgi:hypothetical protein